MNTDISDRIGTNMIGQERRGEDMIADKTGNDMIGLIGCGEERTC